MKLKVLTGSGAIALLIGVALVWSLGSEDAGAATASANPPAQDSITVESPVADLPCSHSAIPDLRGADARWVDQAKVNAFSQRLDRDKTPVSRAQAVADTREMSTGNAAEVQSAFAAAVQVPYRTGGKWFGDSNALIAPERCVWVVTVEAPYQVPRAPRGVDRPILTQYSVIFDAASGEGIGMMAGNNIPNVIDGSGLERPN